MGDGCCCCFTVQSSEVGIVESMGKFSRFAKPGINFIACPFQFVTGKVSLRVRQVDVRCETKTLDNVFVSVTTSVQFAVQPLKVYDAFYKLTDPEGQIEAYVYDVIRSTLPRMTLDQAFEAKDEVAVSVKSELTQIMDQYGFTIMQALVTDLTPDSKVKAAMNEINASKRLKEATVEKAEGEKAMMVKAAEADAESKYLSGVGVAKQRKAIVDGLRDSIMQFSGNVEGTTPKDVIDLLLLTQYFDMLKDVGSHPNTNTVFLPSSNGDQTSQMRDGIMQANTANLMAR